MNALYGVNKKGRRRNSALHVGSPCRWAPSKCVPVIPTPALKAVTVHGKVMGGVLYSLSKRTTLYVDASQVDNKGSGKTFGVSDGLKPVTPVAARPALRPASATF